MMESVSKVSWMASGMARWGNTKVCIKGRKTFDRDVRWDG